MQLQPSQLQIVVEALSGYGIRYNGGTLSRQQQQQLLHVDKDSGDDSKRSGKRSRSSNQESDDIDMKRLKSEQDIGANTPPSVTSGAPPPPLPGSTSDSAQPPGIPPGFGQTLLGQINITQLPLHHVVDIIFESLAANNVPHLFHSFLSTLHLLRLKEGPLPMPPPGVGPPPPGFVPPPLPPEMMPSLPSGMLPLPQPHMLPPHLAGAPGAQPPAPPVVESKAEIKPEIKKEANFSKLQLPRIPDNVQVNITVLPPNHTPTQLPRRPMVVKSDTTTNVPRKDTPSEKNVKAEPKKESDEVQRLKQETFQVRPFEPSAEIPGKHASLVPARKLLEQTFERILGSEHVVSVPGVSGRKMLEAAASHQAGQRPKRDESGAVVPFGHGDAAGYPAKVVTKADWMSIVSRLLTRAFTRESGASEGTASAVDKGVKERMVDYICKDFKQRRELALTWLHEEWYYDGICQREAADMDDREPQYLWCLYKILDGITSGSTQLDLRDRGLTRFLLEVPELPDGAVDIIQKYCDDPARAQLGMACLRDVVNLRPPSRARALEILLSYTTHPEKAQRSMAIVTAKKWYLEHPTVGVKVEEYALAQLETLKDYPVPKRDAVIPVPNEDSNKKGDVDTPMTEAGPRIKTEVADESMVVNNNDNNSSNNRAKSASLEPPSGSTPSSTSKSLSTLAIDKAFLQAEEDIGNLLELYLSLCAKNHALLEVLFRNYISYDPFVQRVIRQKIQPLIKSIKSDSTKLLALIRDFPMGAEMLVLRIIVILTDGVQPSPGLVSAVQDAVIKHDLNARFLIPIIGGLDREAVFNCLPRIVGLLKGTERERRTVTDVFLKLLTGSGRSGGPGQTTSSALSTGSDRRTSNVSAIATTTSSSSLQSSSSASRGPIMSPSELLIELHAIEDTVGWKAACEVLQQLLEQPTIPSLFMRTVIQAITLYKNLVGFVNSMILAKLIPKKVWSRKVLWKGFVRCAKMTQPSSSSVLASLPKPQLKEVLAMEPSLKEPVEAFIKAKSSGRRVGGGAAKQVSVLSVPSSDVVPNTIPTSTPAPTLAINPASSPAAVSTSSAATATIAASIQPDIAIENEVKKEYPSEMDTTVSSTPMDI
ncbi:hypothetical protein BX616_003394 [Lobosporangium transversale]|nr:hypothetical protein BX616_003394 [Lobosporangium transversale]